MDKNNRPNPPNKTKEETVKITAPKPTTVLTYEAWYAEYGCVWCIAESTEQFGIEYSKTQEFTSYRDAADRADEIEAAGHTVNRSWK